MFSSTTHQGRQNGPRREANTKKHHIRDWMRRNKKKEKASSKRVMMSGDPPPPLQASMATIGFDVPDEARHGKISPTTPLSAKPSSPESDAEAIEEVVPIVKKTLPTPEPQPMIERNGFDVKTKKSLNEPEDESCIVNCIYFTQQCCECTIF